MNIDKGFRNVNHKIINHKSLDSIVLIIINFNSDKTRIVPYLKKNLVVTINDLAIKKLQ